MVQIVQVDTGHDVTPSGIDRHPHLQLRPHQCGLEDEGRGSPAPQRGWTVRLHAKGGKQHSMPCRHALAEALRAYMGQTQHSCHQMQSSGWVRAVRRRGVAIEPECPERADRGASVSHVEPEVLYGLTWPQKSGVSARCSVTLADHAEVSIRAPARGRRGVIYNAFGYLHVSIRAPVRGRRPGKARRLEIGRFRSAPL